MLKPDELLEGLKEVLEKRYPGRTVYKHAAPVGFERPSFLVGLGPVEVGDASCGCLEVKAQLLETCFAAEDGGPGAQAAELVQTMAEVQELLAGCDLNVGARRLHAAGSKGQCSGGKAEVSITLSYQDDRPGGEQYPLMAEIQTKIKEE